ncbi:glycosyltransferase [Empedobacter sp. GD03861]|uniref:glycosyltransferase family 2 protein n=1 Tax=Empedobacter sp. GD03861 TaxID=2975390 RepID=UPI0024478929|nr:glycosyltransferase [Empedobacter sp. GD03861]MDH0673326.1 glycosyltransferase [Empedobacter sp. GD03861]
MITIIIKSFNRPHYLDRCLFSIYLNIKGTFKIKVVDDGTPEKYLKKISDKYPDIEIIKTQNYNRKIQSIKDNIEKGDLINGFDIPISDWKETVKKSSDYVLVTEDDVWFTGKLDLDIIYQVMKDKNSSLLKIGWISNRTIKSKIIEEVGNIQFIKPDLFLGNRFVMECILKNKFKIFSLLYRLGKVDNSSRNEYWILNSMLMGVYKRDYWLNVWSTLSNKVDEMEQLINASVWAKKNTDNKYAFSKLNSLIMNTTFQSSATTSYHEHYKINFDVNKFNYYLNEEWYKDNFDVISDFPKDINRAKIVEILDKFNDEKCTSENWILWTNKFKEQYIKQGVVVE